MLSKSLRNASIVVHSARTLSTKIASKDIAMPTPLSLGYDMKYHAAISDDETKPRPLVVVAGWMGAKERQMKPYLKFYHDRNIDTISFAVGPNHVLFPEKAMKQMEAVLNTVSNAHTNDENDILNTNKQQISKPSSVIFHHFSVGGFLFGQALIAMNKQPHLNNFPNIIKAQIFDSPPDYQNISTGISHSAGINGMGQKIIEVIARMYLKLTENTSGVMHRESSLAFHNNYISAPALWFYSKADPVCNYDDCIIVTTKWKEKGTVVEECVWEHTPHIQHGRVDPDRYFGTLDTFLKKHNVI